MASKRVQLTITAQRFFDDAQNKREAVRVWSLPWKLPYYIEKWDSQNEQAKVWVKVPKIPANGSVDLYIYYSNPSAESESDGEAVFEFFDDFSTNEKWTISNTNYIWINTNEGRLYYKSGVAAYAYAQLPQTYNKFKLYVKGVRTRSDQYGVVRVELVDSPASWNNENNAVGIQISYNNDGDYITWADSGTVSYTSNYITEQLNTEYTRLLEYDGSVATLQVIEIASSSISENVGAIEGLDTLQVNTRDRSGQEGYLSLIYLTKYAEQEPTVTVGDEESSDVSGWLYRRKITITNPNSYDLEHFQVAIDLDGSNFDFSKANSDGSDIRVTYGGSRYELPYYIDTWDTATPQAIIWVGIDSETKFYVELNPNNTTDESDPNVMSLPEATGYTLSEFEKYT